MQLREQGLFVKWKDDYWPKGESCDKPPEAEAMTIKVSELSRNYYLGTMKVSGIICNWVTFFHDHLNALH